MSAKVNSKYEWAIYAPSVLIVFSICATSMMLYLYSGETQIKQQLLYIGLSLLFFSMLIIGFFELIIKGNKLAMDEQQVIVNPYFKHFFKTVSFYFKDLDGYKTVIQSSKHADYEVLYLYKGGEKILQVSQFYYENYDALKEYIDNQLKYLGHVPMSKFYEAIKIYLYFRRYI